MAPRVRAVHGEDISDLHLSGDHQPMVCGVADIGGYPRNTTPLGEWKELLIRRLSAPEARVSDDRVGFVWIHKQAQAVGRGTDIADIHRAGTPNLALHSKIPVVAIGSSQIRVNAVKGDQANRGRAGSLRSASYQGNVLIERQVPAVAGGGLRRTGALCRCENNRHVQGLVHGNVVEDVVVTETESAANYGFSVF